VTLRCPGDRSKARDKRPVPGRFSPVTGEKNAFPY
jgi:hypothetical protein